LSQIEVLPSQALQSFQATLNTPNPRWASLVSTTKGIIFPNMKIFKKSMIEQRANRTESRAGIHQLRSSPFALPLKELIDRYRAVLLKTHQEKGH
jgi:hypothetical protein